MENKMEWVINQLKGFVEIGFTKMRITKEKLILSNEKHERKVTDNTYHLIVSDDWRKYYDIQEMIKELELKNKITKIVVEKTNDLLKALNVVLTIQISELVTKIMGEIK
jgi:uncharacterized membrane protein